MSTIAERWAHIRARVEAACERAGRAPSEVTIIAVSKTHPAAAVREAVAAGATDFGENYAQELRDKAALLTGLDGIRWHAIGPLQTNKAKYVAHAAWAFHALDRIEVAKELSRRRTGPPLRCFVEVNVAGEASKTGVPPSAAERLVDEVRELPNLLVVGLMTMPPLAREAEDSRPHFRALRELAARLGLRELSMGTTADFAVAIEEGATCVRVGTAIFGAREG